MLQPQPLMIFAVYSSSRKYKIHILCQYGTFFYISKEPNSTKVIFICVLHI